MASAAHRFFCANVTTPARGIVPLSTRDINGEHVRAALIGRHLDGLMAFLTRRFLDVRPVLEIVLSESRAKRRAVLHRVGLLDVTGIAGGKLLVWLMTMTRVALRMLRHARPQPLIVELVTEGALGRALGHLLRVHLILHLLRVCVIAMREALDSKLSKPRRKLDHIVFSRRCLVTDHAHLAGRVAEVLRVAFKASRMSGQHRLRIVSGSEMTRRAVLSLCLVLLSIVIEWRNDLDYF